MDHIQNNSFPMTDVETTREHENDSNTIKYISIHNQMGNSFAFEVIPNEPDGNCMFRAISQGIFKNENKHSEVRQNIVDFIIHDDNWKKYLPFIQAQHDHLISPNQQLYLMNSDPTDKSVETKNDNINSKFNITPDVTDDKNYYDLLRDNTTELKKHRIQLNLELRNNIKIRKLSKIWKYVYFNYMRCESIFGTMQEMLAASEYFQFNLIVIREVDDDIFNVQNFNEQNWKDTQFFLFTGDSDNGHFEVLFPISKNKLLYNIPNGDYRQVHWKQKIGLIVIQEVLRPTSQSVSKGEDKILGSNTELDKADFVSMVKQQTSLKIVQEPEMNNHLEDSIQYDKIQNNFDNISQCSKKSPKKSNKNQSHSHLEFSMKPNKLTKYSDESDEKHNPVEEKECFEFYGQQQNETSTSHKNRSKHSIISDDKNNNVAMNHLEFSMHPKDMCEQVENNFTEFQSKLKYKNHVQRLNQSFSRDKIKNRVEDRWRFKVEDSMKVSNVSANPLFDVSPRNSSRSSITPYSNQQTETTETILKNSVPHLFSSPLKSTSRTTSLQKSKKRNGTKIKNNKLNDKKIATLKVGPYQQIKCQKESISVLRKGAYFIRDALCCLFCPCIFMYYISKNSN